MKTTTNISKTMISASCAVILCAALSIQANAQCQANFIPTQSSNTVAFTNTSTGGTGTTNYYWSFGDNSTSSATSPTHVYSFNGTYPVCLFMSDSDSVNMGCSSYFCDSIVITNAGNPPCYAAFNYYADSLNNPAGVTFQDQSSNAVSWLWSFGDGTSSTQQNPNHLYSQAGTYSVCLTVINSFGDTCTKCSSVTYFPCTITAGFTFSSAADPQIVFSNTTTGGGAVQYNWNFGDGTTSTATNPTHTYQYSGFYLVYLSAFDSLSSCYSNYYDTITITNAPVQPCNALFISFPDSNSYNVYFSDLSTSGNPILTWSWDFGDNSTSTLINPTHLYSQPGTYLVCLTIATDSATTCTYCDTITVGNGNPAGCSASMYLVKDSLNSNSLTWHAYTYVTGVAPFTYMWTFGDGSSSTLQYPTHTYAAAGSYVICLTITDAANCTSSTCDSTYKSDGPNSIQYFIAVDPTTSGVQETTISVNSVFPNPANEAIEISLNQLVKGDIKITDMMGREVYIEKINATTAKVNVSELPIGYYNLSIVSGNSTSHGKIMIAR